MAIRSKFMYGLEPIQLTQSTIKYLVTFQLKGYRKILNEKTTFQGTHVDPTTKYQKYIPEDPRKGGRPTNVPKLLG